MVGHAEPLDAHQPAGRDDAALVVVHGPNLGRMYRLERKPLTIGSADANEVHLDAEGVFQRHATVVRDDGGAVLIDEQNATRVNDRHVGEVRLACGDVIRIGRSALLFLSGSDIQQKYEEELHRLSKLDTLTLTFNQRFFGDVVEHELQRSLREDRPVAMLMIGLDDFGRYNEEHGRMEGDDLLRGLAALTRNSVFGGVVSRYESDVFSVVLPHARIEQATEKAQALRAAVAEMYGATVSIGAVIWDGVMDCDAFIASALTRLRAAKAAGRDRVSTRP